MSGEKVRLPTSIQVAAPAVETRSLTKGFGPTVAVRSLDLTVPRDSVYLLVGPNGSGKTTTFRILLGLLRPDAGHAAIMGERSGRGAEARALVGFVPETRSSGYGWLRVEELIDHHRRYYRGWDRDYQKRLERLLDIRPGKRYSDLSKGQARRVQLLLALAHRPPVMLLDEPTNGLDPVGREVVFSVLVDHLSNSPTTVLVATHLIYELERFATHVGVIREGELTAQLPREVLRDRLRRYTFDVPGPWDPPSLPAITRWNGTGRRHRWVVWGGEVEIRARLERSHARVRAVEPLSLNDAVVALLGEADRVDTVE